MIYPFRWNIGDHVRVCDENQWPNYRGVTGRIKALELSANKTTAVVQPDDTRRSPLRVHESELRPAL